MQAHTLGGVGNLGTVLLRVYSRSVLPIFIEIGIYLTDKEQNISWHSFLRHGVYYKRPRVSGYRNVDKYLCFSGSTPIRRCSAVNPAKIRTNYKPAASGNETKPELQTIAPAIQNCIIPVT